VTTEQIENYISKKMNRDLKPFFNQYLRTVKIPVFEYSIKGKKLLYRYSNAVESFTIPLRILIEDKPVWLEPTITWQTQKIKRNVTKITMDPNFYLDSKLN
jgi:aminopeptidase N